MITSLDQGSTPYKSAFCDDTLKPPKCIFKIPAARKVNQERRDVESAHLSPVGNRTTCSAWAAECFERQSASTPTPRARIVATRGQVQVDEKTDASVNCKRTFRLGARPSRELDDLAAGRHRPHIESSLLGLSRPCSPALKARTCSRSVPVVELRAAPIGDGPKMIIPPL